MNEQQIVTIVGIASIVLAVIGRWMLFRKAGRAGWLSLIPIVNMYTEYSICWKGWMCLLQAVLAGGASYLAQIGQAQSAPWMVYAAAAAVLIALIIHVRESMKLAASFGKGFLYGLFLVFFDKFGRVVLGLSGAEYVGKP